MAQPKDTSLAPLDVGPDAVALAAHGRVVSIGGTGRRGARRVTRVGSEAASGPPSVREGDPVLPTPLGGLVERDDRRKTAPRG